MTIKIIDIKMPESEATKLSADEMRELLETSDVLSTNESGSIELSTFSIIADGGNFEGHGFMIGTILVCCESALALAGLIQALKNLGLTTAKHNSFWGLQLAIGLASKMDTREVIKRGGEPEDEERISNALQKIFDLAKEPKNPDA